MFFIEIADGWIRTRVQWFQKQPHGQLYHTTPLPMHIACLYNYF